jgi:hypothetical protein
MTVFNKQGTEFTHRVGVDCPSTHTPTYTHSFPVAVAPGVVEERWSTKARPLKSMTKYLQGCDLKRNKDYMVEFNPRTNQFDYWFLEGKYATLFGLMVANKTQEYKLPNQRLHARCPHCAGKFESYEIEWEA